MKFAIIRTGGKQYLVNEGSTLSVERFSGEASFEVLLSGEGEHLCIGTPLVEGARVSVSHEGEVRGRKITTLKYKPKARTRVKRGSRQAHTKVAITKIS